MPERPSLGKCCECEREGPEVRNIIMLPFRSPEPGFGCWGCLVCGLESDGAIAVLCNECVRKGLDDAETIPKYACVGPPAANRRILREQLTEPFEHDQSKHTEEEKESVCLVTAKQMIEEALDEIVEEVLDEYEKTRKKTYQGDGGL